MQWRPATLYPTCNVPNIRNVGLVKHCRFFPREVQGAGERTPPVAFLFAGRALKLSQAKLQEGGAASTHQSRRCGAPRKIPLSHLLACLLARWLAAPFLPSFLPCSFFQSSGDIEDLSPEPCWIVLFKAQRAGRRTLRP